MHRAIPTLLLALLISSVFSSQLTAQGFPGGPPKDVSILLISLDEVMTELEVTSPQLRLTEALQEDLLAQGRARSRAVRAERSAVNAKLWKVVFDAKQAKRLEEIKMQFESLYAVDNESFVKEMKLTDSQVDDIVEIRRERDANSTELALEDVLDKEQLKKWEARLGEPFEFMPETLDLRSLLFRRFRGRGRPRP